MSSTGESPRATGSDTGNDAQGAGNPVGTASPIERKFEEVIDRYLKQTGQENPVSIAEEEAAERRESRRGRGSSRHTRTHSSIYERMLRTVRPSPLLLGLMIGATLFLLMWLGILSYAIELDLTRPFAQFTLIRMQKALALACALWLGTAALLVRAAWQIWRGTRRYREFPPRKPALLLPPSIIRGIDAERSGSVFLQMAFGLVLVSAAVAAVTISMIIW